MTTPLLELTVDMSAYQALAAWSLYIKQHIKNETCLKGQELKTYNILTILDRHMINWKSAPFTDISIFDQIVKNSKNIMATGLLIRSLYDCMEKNESNLKYIKEYVNSYVEGVYIDNILGLVTHLQEKNQLFMNVHSKLNKTDDCLLDCFTIYNGSSLYYLIHRLNSVRVDYKNYTSVINNITFNTIKNYIFKPYVISHVLTNDQLSMRDLVLRRYAALLTSKDTQILKYLLDEPTNTKYIIDTYVSLLELISFIHNNHSKIDPSAGISNKVAYNALQLLKEPIKQKFKEHYLEYYNSYMMFKSIGVNNLDTLIDAVTSKDLQITNQSITFTI